ncbi:hypothetical protein TNCV_2020231 [Trichonephila clavipes]|nr:hypothetical protein TNCV_2020231 [Trichonephila clavipes]
MLYGIISTRIEYKEAMKSFPIFNTQEREERSFHNILSSQLVGRRTWFSNQNTKDGLVTKTTRGLLVTDLTVLNRQLARTILELPYEICPVLHPRLTWPLTLCDEDALGIFEKERC